VRYVDASVERVEVTLNGMVKERHRLWVNGQPVPLHPTGTQGEYVAGIRFRAWRPPSCLHPTIPVQAPLTLGVVDAWNQRSLGGCTYHVSHPGGIAYPQRPVNARAAESRRGLRFMPFGPVQGHFSDPVPRPDPESPITLDLRRLGG
jgi:uncharacterized protein (DUF2126 family)